MKIHLVPGSTYTGYGTWLFSKKWHFNVFCKEFLYAGFIDLNRRYAHPFIEL